MIKKFTTVSVALCTTAFAEIEMPAFFSDGMVLQQQTGAMLWGSAESKSSVTIKFLEKTYQVTADELGAWKCNLKDLQMMKEGAPLTITSGADSKTIKDVLVGEVWLASGQSNMEWTMARSSSKVYARTVNNPLIRQFVSGNVAIGIPQNDFKGKWQAATPEKTSNFSAVAFHFAESLQQELDVPVGIVEIAWGGKPIQAFISDEALEKIPEGEFYKKLKSRALENFDSNNKATKEKKKKIHPNRNPSLHSNIYNGMVHPWLGYGVRGVIWYQGESNTKDAKAGDYQELLESMVGDWRERWEQPLSFYWVQLSSFKAASSKPAQVDHWATVQDEMRRALKTIPKSGMAVTTDIGNAKNIHPENKKDVGIRLAKWALTFDYGKKDIQYSGPLFKTSLFEEGKAIISFDHASGLTASDSKALRMFELAGADGKWEWADAKILGDTVVVTSAKVQSPQKVRYAWRANALKANLINSSGLPASCFSSETK